MLGLILFDAYVNVNSVVFLREAFLGTHAEAKWGEDYIFLYYSVTGTMRPCRAML